MSMSNLISININIMDMETHMLICLFIFMLVSKETDEIIIRIRDIYQEMSEVVTRIRGNYQEESEAVRLGNEIIIFGNVF